MHTGLLSLLHHVFEKSRKCPMNSREELWLALGNKLQESHQRLNNCRRCHQYLSTGIGTQVGCKNSSSINAKHNEFYPFFGCKELPAVAYLKHLAPRTQRFFLILPPNVFNTPIHLEGALRGTSAFHHPFPTPCIPTGNIYLLRHVCNT